mgnify:FL=1
MSKRWRLALSITAALLVATAAGVAWLGYRSWQQIHRPFRGYSDESILIYVARGAGATEILATLEAQGVIADARLARLYLIHKLQDHYLKAGEYRFEEPL